MKRYWFDEFKIKIKIVKCTGCLLHVKIIKDYNGGIGFNNFSKLLENATFLNILKKYKHIKKCVFICNSSYIDTTSGKKEDFYFYLLYDIISKSLEFEGAGDKYKFKEDNDFIYCIFDFADGGILTYYLLYNKQNTNSDITIKYKKSIEVVLNTNLFLNNKYIKNLFIEYDKDIMIYSNCFANSSLEQINFNTESNSLVYLGKSCFSNTNNLKQINGMSWGICSYDNIAECKLFNNSNFKYIISDVISYEFLIYDILYYKFTYINNIGHINNDLSKIDLRYITTDNLIGTTDDKNLLFWFINLDLNEIPFVNLK